MELLIFLTVAVYICTYVENKVYQSQVYTHLANKSDADMAVTSVFSISAKFLKEQPVTRSSCLARNSVGAINFLCRAPGHTITQ